MEYAGVFLVDGDPQDVEEAFAQAEPPTHDDWVPDVLSNRKYKTWVRVGIREIKRSAQEFILDQYGQTRTSSNDPLDSISFELGNLILAQSAGGDALRQKGTNGRKKERRSGKPGIRMFDGARLELQEHGRAALFLFELTGVIPKEGGTTIKGHPRVVVMGGSREFGAPAGASIPQILRWIDPMGRERGGPEGVELTADDAMDGKWTVIVSVPEDALVGISLHLGQQEVQQYEAEGSG